jgi:transcriptional regulator with GAF, ATPase, and Fis domain
MRCDPEPIEGGSGVLSVAQQARLYEATRGLGEQVDLAALLQTANSRARELIEAESSAIMLLDPAADELFVPYVADVAPEVERRWAGVRFPADRGIAGAVLRSGQIELVPDVASDPRWYRQVDGQTGMVTHALLCAPLCTRAGTIGVLSLRNKRDGEFGAAEVELLAAYARAVAAAIDTARQLGGAREDAARLRDEVAALQGQAARGSAFGDMVGHSPAMRDVFRLLESAAPLPVTVLIRGESGTGKELIARAIHFNGPRRARPFVAVNCGALTETLLASELFGHRKHAFTGAMADRKGLFEVADGGTIFLDEVGDMPPSMQVQLLRVLQEGEVLPVGDTQPRRVDVRIISATHRDLPAEVRAGRFREDLYYRLAAFPIALPPLRDRRDDIPMLVVHLASRTAERFGIAVRQCTPEALERLIAYDWPGNVRELQNAIEYAAALAPGGIIGPDNLPAPVRAARGAAPRPALPTNGSSLRQAREAFERDFVARVLAEHAGNASRAARALGLSRVMLQRKIRVWNLRGR